MAPGLPHTCDEVFPSSQSIRPVRTGGCIRPVAVVPGLEVERSGTEGKTDRHDGWTRSGSVGSGCTRSGQTYSSSTILGTHRPCERSLVRLVEPRVTR